MLKGRLSSFLVAAALLICSVFMGVYSVGAVTETMYGTGTPSGDYEQYAPWGAGHELGNIFKSSANGQVTKVRFYACAAESGAHSVSIWNWDTSTKIAGNFSWTPSTGAGWKEYTLGTAVNITANVNYMVVVSSGTDSGRNRGIFKNCAVGNNGSYLSWPDDSSRYGSIGSMPTTISPTWKGNYERDVVFQVGSASSSAPPSSSMRPSSAPPSSSMRPSSSAPPASSTPVVTQTMFGTGTPSGSYQQFGTWAGKDEIGNIFRASVNGNVTKVRYYSGANETGSHNVSIWNYDTSTKLAGPFAWTPSTGAGWKEYTLGSAVAITANVNYMVVVSAGDETARYRAIFQNMVAGNNGGYLSWPNDASRSGNPGTMPTTLPPGYQQNYERDVVFTTGAPASSAIASSAPPASSTGGGGSQVSGYNLTFTGQTQAFTAAPADNPLKGFLPFKGSYSNPHSMEWWYIPFTALMNGADSYTFNTGLEPILNEISGRGHQAAFRIFLDYPNEYPNGATPQFIWNMGVAQHYYNNAAGVGIMPDWQDQRLIDVLDDFVTEFGSIYDGDSRIGFITTGLIGHWGEWHTWPEDSLMSSGTQCNQIYAAYDAAFDSTKICTRNPDTGNPVNYNIGFHDDSFTESTIGSTSWYFMPRMVNVGATNKYHTEAIGGEFRPEGQMPFINGTPLSGYQDYNSCVDQTHCSWLIMHQAFGSLNSTQLNRVTTAEKKLGYELQVSATTAQIPATNSLNAYVNIQNNGVAPFYYNWSVKLALANTSNTIVQEYSTNWDIRNIQPGDNDQFNSTISLSSRSAGTYKLVMKVNNPLSGGHLFKFANNTQDANVNGWVTLATVTKS